jgi:predicted transcriptional regulator
MNKVKISVGGDGRIGADGARQLAFENWQLLARVLTGKRVELLRHVRRHQVASVRALAKALGRDYRNVHTDVQTLIRAGLLDNSANGLRVDYDVIETKIAI